VKYSADAECEIIHCVNCETSHFVRCEMKFARHICEANISQRSYFTWALPNFTRRRRISLKKAHLRCRCAFFWRRHPDLNRGIKVLQTYFATLYKCRLKPMKSRGLTIFIIVKNSFGRELDGSCFLTIIIVSKQIQFVNINL